MTPFSSPSRPRPGVAGLLAALRRPRRSDGRERAAEAPGPAAAAAARAAEAETGALRRRFPDAAGLIRLWEASGFPEPDAGTPGDRDPGAPETGSSLSLVLGHGAVRGGDGGVLIDAPVVLPLGGGVAVRGPVPVAAALIRALAVQVVLRAGRDAVRLVGETEALGLDLLHPGGSRRLDGRTPWRLGVRLRGPVPAADALLCRVGEGAPVPAGIRTAIDCVDPASARLWVAGAAPGPERDGRGSGSPVVRTMPLSVAALSRAQAGAFARAFAARHGPGRDDHHAAAERTVRIARALPRAEEVPAVGITPIRSPSAPSRPGEADRRGIAA